MAASALHAPTRFARLTSAPSLLRLRSDEQLVSLLRGGSHDAFRAIHDRYGQRLFAYVRQMLGPGSRQDAEDVLQDVFARTYTTLKTEDREINLRPWLYRVAHNRCIDHLRRPGPATAELVETSAKALHDPFEEVQRREDLQRLVADIGRLPDQQKSALLLREINGLSYRELAETLDITVPAVKSLLVRARVELVETAEARDAACSGVREELSLACDARSSRPSPLVRRHLRDCAGCREYQAGIRGMRRSFAALSPVAVFGPLAVAAKVAGFGGSGGTAGAGAGGGGMAGAVTSGGLTAATAGKVAAVVTTAAITAGGAVEIERRVGERASAGPAAETRSPRADEPTGGGSVPATLSGSRAPAAERTTGGGGGNSSSRRRERDRATGGTGDGRRESTRTRRPGSPALGGERAAGGAPVAEGAPGGPTRPEGSGGAAPGSPARPDGGGAPAVDLPSPAGAPVLPPPELPAQAPETPAAPEVPPPTVPDAAAPTPVLPLPTVEVPAPPRVKEKVTDKLKPEKVIGPKPGRGPSVDVGL